ncbi:fructose-bisphosphate aldolase-lysine N-methyltransferase, chloroplastic [Trifolium repens]|nr:fructose-bisphosphate aldolase-lysine N-methyltransferase, chloroplastic [Trifolium repens]
MIRQSSVYQETIYQKSQMEEDFLAIRPAIWGGNVVELGLFRMILMNSRNKSNLFQSLQMLTQLNLHRHHRLNSKFSNLLRFDKDPLSNK